MNLGRPRCKEACGARQDRVAARARLQYVHVRIHLEHAIEVSRRQVAGTDVRHAGVAEMPAARDLAQRTNELDPTCDERDQCVDPARSATSTG